MFFFFFIKQIHNENELFSLRFMVIPDMLKNAPMFKKLDARIKVCESAHLFNGHSLTIQL